MSDIESSQLLNVFESSHRKPGGYAPPVRRARAACTACRARKIRCTSRHGEPCATCVFEHVQCVVTSKPRGSKRDSSSRTKQNVTESRANKATPPGSTDSQAPAADLEHHPSHRQCTVDLVDFIPSDTNVLDAQVSQPPSPAVVHQIQSSDLDRVINDTDDGESSWLEAAIKAVPLPRIMDSLRPFASEWASQSGSMGPQPPPVIPSFLKQPPPGLAEDDLRHLRERGAISIPELGLREALIESYVLYFHPNYPVLDVDLLYSSVRGTSNQPFSLLAFQAVMFIGSCWVDHKLLRRLGFLSRKAARKAFYWKARLLYDADYEHDEISQLQALIMMSTWWEGSRGTKDGSHWHSIALSLAQCLGLHRPPALSLSPKTRALRRCLWWSCIIRDTVVSLAKSRAPLIQPSFSSVTPLTLDDFGLEGQDPTYRQSIDPGEEEKRRVATICIHTASICHIITRALHTAYDRREVGKADAALFLNSGANHTTQSVNLEPTHEIAKDLQKWWTTTPPQVLHARDPSPPASPPERASLVHRAMLSILYHTGRIILYRQQDRSPDTQDLVRRTLISLDSVVRDAALQINQITMDAYTADFVKDMPPTFISCLLRASQAHVLQMRNQNPHLRQEGRQRLEECRQALREVADGHVSAEWAINFLAHVETWVGSLSGPVTTISNRPSRMGCRPPAIETTGGIGHQRLPTETSSVPTGSDISIVSMVSPSDGVAADPTTPLAAQMSSAPGPSRSLTPSRAMEDLTNYSPFSDSWFDLLDTSYKLPDMSWVDSEEWPMALG